MKIISLLLFVNMILAGCGTVSSSAVGPISADLKNSVREQIEQTEEIKNATELISGQLGDINLYADDILNAFSELNK